NDFELLDTPGILWHKFEDPVVGTKLALTGAIKDTLFHKDDIALYALDVFLENYPGRVDAAYNINEEKQTDHLPDLLMSLTKKMNFDDEYGRGSEKLIYDVRDGRLGSYTLDEAPASPLQADEVEE